MEKIEHLLNSPLKREIFRVMSDKNERSINDLMDILKRGRSWTFTETEQLVKSGILTKRKVGNAGMYSIIEGIAEDDSHPISITEAMRDDEEREERSVIIEDDLDEKKAKRTRKDKMKEFVPHIPDNELLNISEEQIKLLIPPRPIYVDGINTDVVRKKSEDHAVLLWGEKGAGKTSLVERLAAEDNVPLVTVQCYEGLQGFHLEGFFRGEGEFVIGPVTLAVLIANRIGKCYLLFDEFNALDSNTGLLTNSLTDYRKLWQVSALNVQLRLVGDLKVFYTLNPGYRGTSDQNEATIDRPIKHRVKFLTINKMKAIINANGFLYDSELTKFFYELRKLPLNYVPSTRTLIRWHWAKEKGLTIGDEVLNEFMTQEDFRKVKELLLDRGFSILDPEW